MDDFNFGGALPLFGNAVSQLFGSSAAGAMAQGSMASASAYDQAAEISRQNARLAAMSTNITQYQLGRQIDMVGGKQRAAVGASGFTMGGSAADIFKSTVQQGALAKAVMGIQGQINVNAETQKATSYMGMASQARSAASAQMSQSSGSMFGSIFSGVGGLLALFSDEQIKENLKLIDTVRGIRVYEFNFKGEPRRYKGVIAQEVRNTHPWAVHEHESGLLMVDYAAIDMAYLVQGDHLDA